MDGVTVADLVGLVPVLVAAFGVVMGVVVLVTGWQWFSDRRPARRRRGVVVPLVGVIVRGGGGVR